MKNSFKLLAFDADDTLWCCEMFFRTAEKRFAALFPYPPSATITRYREIAEKNLPVRGYGIKSSLAAMLECALALTNGRITPEQVKNILALNSDLAEHPLKLYPGVAETIALLSKHFRLAVITKGDPAEQERKMRASGLQRYFSGMTVLAEKTPEAYASLLTQYNISPAEFLMTGDSLAGDIYPVKKIGGSAIFLTGTSHWQQDTSPLPPDAEITSLRELPELLNLAT